MAAFTLTNASHILRGTGLRCSTQRRTLSLWSTALLNSTQRAACPKLSENVLRRTLPTLVQSRPISTPSKILQFVKTDVWGATHRSGYGRVPPPPRRRSLFSAARDFIDSLPSGLFTWGILALNGVVLLAWAYANDLARYQRDHVWLKWMYDNFLVSMHNVKEGRIWTVLTCCFSHQEPMHFTINAFTYYFMAPVVIAIVGNASFLALYLGGGIMSSCLSLLFGQQIRHKDVPSHGASGAIYAVLSFFACVAPTAQLAIFGIVPCPAWVVVGGLFLYDGWLSIQGGSVRTDNAGHVGGMLAGVGYYVLKRMGMRL